MRLGGWRLGRKDEDVLFCACHSLHQPQPLAALLRHLPRPLGVAPGPGSPGDGTGGAVRVRPDLAGEQQMWDIGAVDGQYQHPAVGLAHHPGQLVKVAPWRTERARTEMVTSSWSHQAADGGGWKSGQHAPTSASPAPETKQSRQPLSTTTSAQLSGAQASKARASPTVKRRPPCGWRPAAAAQNWTAPSAKSTPCKSPQPPGLPAAARAAAAVSGSPPTKTTQHPPARPHRLQARTAVG